MAGVAATPRQTKRESGSPQMQRTLMNCEPRTKSMVRALSQGWVTTLLKKPTHFVDVCLPASTGRLARNPDSAHKARAVAQVNVDASIKRLLLRVQACLRSSANFLARAFPPEGRVRLAVFISVSRQEPRTPMNGPLCQAQVTARRQCGS